MKWNFRGYKTILDGNIEWCIYIDIVIKLYQYCAEKASAFCTVTSPHIMYQMSNLKNKVSIHTTENFKGENNIIRLILLSFYHI